MYADRTGFVKTIHETTLRRAARHGRRRHSARRSSINAGVDRHRRRGDHRDASATRSPRTRRSPRASRRRRSSRSGGRSTFPPARKKVAELMRATRFLIPTLRDAPADAQADLPPAARPGRLRHARSARACGRTCRSAGASTAAVEQIIREEMDAIGGQEMLMPVLHPAEIWKRSGPLRHRRRLQAEGPRRPRPRARDHARGDRRAARRRRRSAAIATCRRSGTTSRSRSGTSRARRAASCARASSS